MAVSNFISRDTAAGIPIYRFPQLPRTGALDHAITTRWKRPGLDFNLSFSNPRDFDEAAANRKTLCRALGLDIERLTVCRQVHGARVAVITEKNAGRGGLSPESAIEQCDAMVTERPGVPMLILCADCPVVLLWDPQKRAAGLAHCGWRGILAGIVANTVAAMTENFGTNPATLIACCGPSIGPCCCEVGRDVAERFRDAFPGFRCVVEKSGTAYLDLRAAVTAALKISGVPAQNAFVCDTCTKCKSDEFFSYRAEGERAGRFAFVAVVP